jgi:hypothetical protein
VYSHCFNIYDQHRDLIYTTGERIHDSSNNNGAESIDYFDFALETKENDLYFISYDITTINGLKVSSPHYRISERTTIDPEIAASLGMILDEEDGFI